MANAMSFKRHRLPVGDEEIPVLVASDGAEPKAVFMSYDSFLDLAATLYTAIEALRNAGVDPAVLAEQGDEEIVTPDDRDEFASWDDGFDANETETPHLRLVVGG